MVVVDARRMAMRVVTRVGCRDTTRGLGEGTEVDRVCVLVGPTDSVRRVGVAGRGVVRETRDRNTASVVGAIAVCHAVEQSTP